MKLAIFTLFTGTLLLFSCRKQDTLLPEPGPVCELQTDNPAGRSYSSGDVVNFVCTSNHCGFLPLSTRNFWVYEDSIFDNGTFVSVRLDTLRYSTTFKSTTDGLVWWQGNLDIGLPDRLYANDSAVFQLADRLFAPGMIDAKKDYGMFEGDSLRYLASFQDAAAIGRSIKMNEPVSVPAGTFNNWIFFEKNARTFRKDQVFFKPGIGVLKYRFEQAPMGSPQVKLQQVLTLVSYHIE